MKKLLNVTYPHKNNERYRINQYTSYNPFYWYNDCVFLLGASTQIIIKTQALSNLSYILILMRFVNYFSETNSSSDRTIDNLRLVRQK